MVSKRKQQNNSRIEGVMQQVAEAFAAAVVQCVEDADADAVHRVRTGSRRLEVMLKCASREQPARVWLRQLKKIRRAAGPVRDLDVQRKLLSGWMGAHPLHGQANKLDGWLKNQRKEKAPQMQKQIAKQWQRLEQQQTSLLAAWSAVHLADAAVRPSDASAVDIFVRAADAIPRLNAENLHDLRKAAKKARYLAEAGSAAPTSASKALKRIQDGIGAWHDWLCLQRDANEALGKDAPGLTAALDREVTRHFSSAIKITESMRGRLLGEWLAGKRPAASAAIPHRRTA